LQVFDLHPVGKEVMDITAWVFIWQATSQFWLDRHSIVIKESKMRKLSKCDVRFVPLDAKTRKIVEKERQE
jgi:hypothetical protein